MQTADVLIIGARIAGASMAYELAPFADVIVLERESQPGYHATGRSAAVFGPAYGNRVIRALTAASRRFYEERADGLADHPVLTRRGSVIVAPEGQVEALLRLRRELGETLEDIAPRRALELVPVLDPDYVAVAAFDPDTADLDVAAIHQAYLRAFRARGGRVVTDAEVLTIGAEAPPFEVQTRAGVFAAAVLVNAAGAWADGIAQMAGAPSVGLVPARRTAFVFEPSVAVEPAWPEVTDAEETFYFKPEGGHLLGSPADETPVAASDVQPEEIDVATAIDRIERAATFEVRRVVRAWAGFRTFAADRVPVVGMDERAPGFFWLAGQGGYGIQIAPALGRAAAQLLVDGVLPDDLLAHGLIVEDLWPLRLRAA